MLNIRAMEEKDIPQVEEIEKKDIFTAVVREVIS